MPPIGAQILLALMQEMALVEADWMGSHALCDINAFPNQVANKKAAGRQPKEL